MMKPFRCLNCNSHFGNTDGEILIIPFVYLCGDIRKANLVTFRQLTLLECGCGMKSVWRPVETPYIIVERNLTPLLSQSSQPY